MTFPPSVASCEVIFRQFLGASRLLVWETKEPKEHRLCQPEAGVMHLAGQP